MSGLLLLLFGESAAAAVEQPIKEAVLAYLLDQDGLTDLVGSRISPGRRHQRGALPAVTYQQVSRQDWGVLSGGHARLPEVRFQFDCWGATDKEASNLADVLRSLLNWPDRGYWGERFVQSCRLEESGRDDYYPPEHGDDRAVYVVTMDAIISFEGA